MHKKNYKFISWLIPAIIVVAVMTIWPFINLIINSFNGDNPAEYFNAVVHDNDFQTALTNTLVIVAIVPLANVALSAFMALTITSITFKFARRSMNIVVIVQYVFISSAVATGFMLLFQNQGGFINWILEMTGNDQINWYSSENMMSNWMNIIYLILTAIPFITTTFTAKFISTNIKYAKMFKIDEITSFSFKRDKIILKENYRILFLFLGVEAIQAVVAYPIGLYAGDINSMFSASGQTLMGYINHALYVNNINLSSAASLITLGIMLVPAAIVYGSYKAYEVRYVK